MQNGATRTPNRLGQRPKRSSPKTIHRLLKPGAVYMKKVYANVSLTCFKRFLKLFANKTIVNKDSYPEYRRRRIVDNVNVR